MSISVLRADAFPIRISHYVPAMKYDAAVHHTSPFVVDFGAPIVADPDGILDGQSIAAVSSTSTFVAASFTARSDGLTKEEVMGRYGRCLTVVASGAATTEVSVHGRDYLGQKMSEELTLNGTTAVVGLKAFKHIDLVEWEDTAAVTIDLGWGDKLGLPYKTRAVLREYEDDVLAAAGTFVAPVTTDPATKSTGDPRGTYDPTGTLDGSAEFKIECRVSNAVNASGNGGLHGIAHYGVATESYT